MQLTIHGTERVQGRTRMLLKDVIATLNAGAFVSLGVDSEREYLLFYSAPDKRCKVAITSLDRNRLITIWEKYFRFPPGVSRVNRTRALEARKAMQEFLKKRIAETFTPEPFTCTLEVLDRGQVIHSLLLGAIPRRLDTPALIATLREQMMPVVAAVEEHKEKAQGTLGYRFVLANAFGYRSTTSITHEKLFTRLH